jgi:transposase-like protein
LVAAIARDHAILSLARRCATIIHGADLQEGLPESCPCRRRQPRRRQHHLHASFKTEAGQRQRCLCKTCCRTFSANTGTAYAGLRCSRGEFDQVVTMRVEGVSISAIARIAGRSRSTITRWLERSAVSAKRFNDEHLRKFEIKELQADELCTFIGKKTETR